MEVYRENKYRAIETCIQPIRNAMSRKSNGARRSRQMYFLMARKWAWGSFVHFRCGKHPLDETMRLRWFPPSISLFVFLLLPLTVLAYPELVTNDGHGITSRKLHPYHPLLPRECASPRLLDYSPDCESFYRNTALPFSKTERSGFPR